MPAVAWPSHGRSGAISVAARLKDTLLKWSPPGSVYHNEALKIVVVPTANLSRSEQGLRALLVALLEAYEAGRVPPFGKEPMAIRPSENKALHRSREEQRYALLRAIYDATNGSTHNFVNMFEVGSSIQLDRGDTKDAASYLEAEGFIEFRYIGGGISITHQGLREVERTKRDPAASDVFSAITVTTYNTTINNTGSGNVVNQQGTGNQASVAVSPERAKLREAFEGLRGGLQSLPEPQREEAFELVREIEIQADAEVPKKGVVKSLLATLNTEPSDAVQLGQFIATIAAAFGVA